MKAKSVNYSIYSMMKCNQSTNDANVSHMAHHGPLAGPALVIGSINIEGFSSDKAEMLSSICSKCDIVCMQETHRKPNHRRLFLKGMNLLADFQHGKYGSAIFSRPDIAIEYTNTANSEDNIKIITVCLRSISTTSV